MAAKVKAREHQVPMLDFVLNTHRGNLFASMGAGKTLVILMALQRLLMTGEVNRVLILAPLLVASMTWPEENEKWGMRAIRMVSVTGKPDQRLKALRDPDANVFVMNYENLPWLVEQGFEDFDMIVCDESTRIAGYRKRKGSIRAAALAKFAFLATRFINMTGTPAPNGLQSLWGMQYFIDKGETLYDSYGKFTQMFFWQQQVDKNTVRLIPKHRADRQIHRLMRRTSLTIDAAEWFGVDKPIVNDVYCDLPPKVRRIYEQVENEFAAELESGIIEAKNAGAKSQKLLQIAAGAVYLTDPDTGLPTDDWEELHTAKRDALDNVINEANGAPIIIAYQFAHDLERLKKWYPQGKRLDTAGKVKAAWNRGEVPILFMHPASGGHGLSLQDGGQHIVFMNTGYNLEHYLQIIERIGPVRQMQAGHPRPVFVYRIFTRNTVDMVTRSRVETKRGVMDLLLDYCKDRNHCKAA